jgi:glutamate dehydrogenase
MAELVLESELPEDPYLADRLVTYFPVPLRERFVDAIAAHPLRREIITTITVNRFVNSQGITAYHRLAQETGRDVEAIVRAQLAARSILGVAESERRIRDADGVDATTSTDVRVELRRMVERASRWLLNHRRTSFEVQPLVEAFAGGIGEVRALLPELLPPSLLQQAEELKDVLVGGGLDEDFAKEISFAQYAHLAFPVVQSVRVTGRPLPLVADVHFKLMELLGLDAVIDAVDVLPRTTRWETMARAALRDDLQALMGLITQAAMGTSEESDAAAIIDAWRQEVKRADEEAALLRQICEGESDLAKMSVALRVVRSLVTS